MSIRELQKIDFFFVILLAWILVPAKAQQDPLIPKAIINIEGIDQVSVDNQGYLFVSDKEGNISQFEKNGKKLNVFSPDRQGRLNQLEATWTVNIFSFSADLQEYRILDRFLNPIAENRIPQDEIGLAKAATLGNNNIIWILDESDISLNQFDYKRNIIIQHQPLGLILNNVDLDVIDIREYQNLLFLNIRNLGVYIFDNQANFIKLLPLKIDQKLSFWKTNLLFMDKGEVNMVDFQTGESENIPITIFHPAIKILIHQNDFILCGSDQIWIYPLELIIGNTF